MVGKKPRSLSFEEAAALPLTSIAAYEALFDRLEIQRDVLPKNILIIGAAGCVGSIAIQLAKALTPHRVIATASREESKVWCLEMGADYVIDHSASIADQIKNLKIDPPKYVLGLNETGLYLAEIADLIAPQGKLCLIDDPQGFDILPFKKKSVSVHWELMFTRSLFNTEDLNEQHKLLNRVSELLDEKRLRCTSSRSFGSLNAKNLRQAHAYLEGRSGVGKVTLHVDKFASEPITGQPSGRDGFAQPGDRIQHHTFDE